MDAFEILVLILSIILGIGLLLFALALIYIVKIVKNIKKISDKATSLVENASSAAAILKRGATPSVVAKFVAEQVSSAVKRHSNKKKGE